MTLCNILHKEKLFKCIYKFWMSFVFLDNEIWNYTHIHVHITDCADMVVLYKLSDFFWLDLRIIIPLSKLFILINTVIYIGNVFFFHYSFTKWKTFLTERCWLLYYSHSHLRPCLKYIPKIYMWQYRTFIPTYLM